MRAFSGTVFTIRTVSEGAGSFLWTPATGLDCPTCPSPTVTLSASTTYIVEVSNSDGCKATDSINIAVTCAGDAVFFANTFTPNADGENDWFYPQCISGVNVKHFMVYDRWGERVFEAQDIATNSPDKGWNGSFRSTPLKPDVYVYVAELTCADGTPLVLKGDIALIR
jgi:gliding motility-associated-like protein